MTGCFFCWELSIGKHNNHDAEGPFCENHMQTWVNGRSEAQLLAARNGGLRRVGVYWGEYNHTASVHRRYARWCYPKLRARGLTRRASVSQIAKRIGRSNKTVNHHIAGLIY
jgi:hypothetical protein